MWGIIFVSIGILIGFLLQTPETLVGGVYMYPHIDLLRIANNNPYFQLAGFPAFLVRHTSANMFYNFGMSILIIAISFYFIDIKKKSNMAISMFIYYGKISLSLFLLHLLFITLFLSQFNVIIFLYVSIAYIAFLGILMYIWMEYGKGVGSPEWIMVQIGRIGHKTGDTVRKGYKKYLERKKLEDYFIEHD